MGNVGTSQTQEKSRWQEIYQIIEEQTYGQYNIFHHDDNDAAWIN